MKYYLLTAGKPGLKGEANEASSLDAILKCRYSGVVPYMHD